MTPSLVWLEWMGLLAGFGVLHAFWQTLVVGAVIGALNRLSGFARPGSTLASPRLRYSVGFALFLSLPAVAILTLAAMAAWGEAGLVSGISSDGTLVGSPSPLTRVLPWIGAGWFLGAIVGAGRLVRDAAAERSLRREGRPVGDALAEAVARCARRLDLRGTVDLLCSPNIRAPCVVGLRSSALLVPSGLSALLDADQIEGIIAHELAHIRRRDLIARAGQRLVHVLLFFHPVAGRISRTIDRERELCCDDLVTRAGVARFTYARALAQLAVSTHASLAVGLGVSTGNIAARVRRLMSADLTAGCPPIALRATAVVVGALLASALITASLLPASAWMLRAAPAWETRLLTDIGGSFQVNATDPAGEFTLAVERGRAVGASLDGRPISSDRIEQRGAHVKLPIGTAAEPGGTFVVRILPDGIEWPARDRHSGSRGPES